jgi:hypothetical protein
MVKREEINIFDLRVALEYQQSNHVKVVVEEGKVHIEYNDKDGWQIIAGGKCVQKGHDKEEIIMGVMMITGGTRRVR